MSLSVIVPRGGDCPYRERAWQWVRAQFDEVEIVEGGGDPDRWCKADAVADALERASGDLLIIHDADVWSDHLDTAIEAVETGRALWASPHRHVRRLTEHGTTQFFDGERETAEVEEDHFSKLGGGIVVLARDTYERCPLDPRFIGWGGEDDAFGAALRTLAGEPWVGRQPLWHLWHPPQARISRKVGNEANDALRGQYVGVKTQAKRMRDLIEEGRQCRSSSSSPRP